MVAERDDRKHIWQMAIGAAQKVLKKEGDAK